MIKTIILLWICIQLNAPVWIYVLLGIEGVAQLITLGIKLGKSGD